MSSLEPNDENHHKRRTTSHEQKNDDETSSESPRKKLVMFALNSPEGAAHQSLKEEAKPAESHEEVVKESDLVTQVQALQAQLAQKDEEMKAQLAQKDEELAKKDEELAKKDEKIAQKDEEMKAKLAKKDEVIANLETKSWLISMNRLIFHCPNIVLKTSIRRQTSHTAPTGHIEAKSKEDDQLKTISLSSEASGMFSPRLLDDASKLLVNINASTEKEEYTENYESETDISNLVTPALKDAITLASELVGTKLAVRHEASLFSQRPDHLVVYADSTYDTPVLVVEVKKPYTDLTKPTRVMGQIFDYLVAERAYGHHSPVAILTTFEKSVFLWQEDKDSNAIVRDEKGCRSEAIEKMLKEKMPKNRREKSPSSDQSPSTDNKPPSTGATLPLNEKSLSMHMSSSNDNSPANDKLSSPFTSSLTDTPVANVSPSTNKSLSPPVLEDITWVGGNDRYGYTKCKSLDTRLLRNSKEYSCREMVELLFTAIVNGFIRNPRAERTKIRRPTEGYKGDVLRLVKESYSWVTLNAKLGHQILELKPDGEAAASPDDHDVVPGARTDDHDIDAGASTDDHEGKAGVITDDHEAYYVISLFGLGSTSKIFLAYDHMGKEWVIKMYTNKYDDSKKKLLENKYFLSKAETRTAAEVDALKRMYGSILVGKIHQKMLNGFYCVVMPFFEPISKEQRKDDTILEEIEKVLNRLHEKEKYRDCDRLWCHIGHYVDEGGNKHVILFDLGDLEISKIQGAAAETKAHMKKLLERA